MPTILLATPGEGLIRAMESVAARETWTLVRPGDDSSGGRRHFDLALIDLGADAGRGCEDVCRPLRWGDLPSAGFARNPIAEADRARARARESLRRSTNSGSSRSELANMVSGAARTFLHQNGVESDITPPPAILVGGALLGTGPEIRSVTVPMTLELGSIEVAVCIRLKEVRF